MRTESQFVTACDNAISRTLQQYKTNLAHRDATPGASATLNPVAACDWNPRQRRFRGCWAACRLSTAAILPLQSGVALSRGQNLEDFVHKLGKRCYQAEKQQRQVHRQITSFRRRRRCRLAGLMPLTCGYCTNLFLYFKHVFA